MIRILTNNPWEGGGGYTFKDVGDMTLDQVYLRLIDVKRLKSAKASRPVETIPIGEKIKGRAADGTPITAIVRGKSVARELNERAAERRRDEGRQKRKRRKKKRKA